MWSSLYDVSHFIKHKFDNEKLIQIFTEILKECQKKKEYLES